MPSRFVNPFVAVLTAILGIAYAYLALRLATGLPGRIALAVPFVLIWLVPVLYWVGDREGGTLLDDALHFGSYASMGWVNFALLLCLARDALLVAGAWIEPLHRLQRFLLEQGSELVIGGAFLMFAAGMVIALRGPSLRRIEIPIEGLHPALEGLRIAQISDLHVGPTIRAGYVRRVVEKANALEADLVALTGDFVDGTVEALSRHVAPLAGLMPARRVFFIPGNHEYYSGFERWMPVLRSLGFELLLNEHRTVRVGDARVLVGGVVDPAAGRANPPRADLAAGRGEAADFRLLLAHHPKLAPLGEAAGFDLQLSGHTHAGQFFPWTIAVRILHGPHVAGLSRLGRMWVYVSAGTGTWGPPVRFGTRPELTLLRLVRA